jgi:hypothetical protein
MITELLLSSLLYVISIALTTSIYIGMEDSFYTWPVQDAVKPIQRKFTNLKSIFGSSNILQRHQSYGVPRVGYFITTHPLFLFFTLELKASSFLTV